MKRAGWQGVRGERAGLAVFVWALAVRALTFFDARHAPFWAFQLVDESAYVELAQGLLHHTALPHGAWYVAPGYAYLLAAAFAAGGGADAVKLVQLFTGAVNAWLVWRLSRRLAPPGIAAIAAGLFATAPVVLLQELLLLKTTFATFAVLLALELLLPRHTAAAAGASPAAAGRAPRRGRAAWAGAGIALGAAALLRGELAVMAVALSGVGFAAARRGWPGAPDRAAQALFLAGWLAVTAVPTVQNARGSGAFVPIAFGGGTNLYIGNHHGADGSYVPLRPDRFDPAQEESDAVDLAGHALGRTASPAEVSRYWTRAAARYWRESPVAAVRLTLRKLAMVLGPWEAADVLSTAQAGRWVRTLHNPLAVPALFLPLACVGFVCTRRTRGVWPLHTAFAASVAAVVPFFVFERFRVHLLALAVPLAAAAVHAGWCAWRAGRRRPLLWGAGTALAILFATGSVRVPRDENVLRVNIGELYFQAGRYDEALQEFQAVQAASPGAWRVGINIANLEAARGRTAAALAALEPVLRHLQAEAARTGRPSAEEMWYCHELAGDLLYGNGATAAAGAHYREAVRHAPTAATPTLRAKLSACESPPGPAR